MLFTPLDPVVASGISHAAANEAIATLGRAGYRRAMLDVVGCDGADTGQPMRKTVAAPWATSGVLWGLLWIAFTALATWTVPLGGHACGALVLVAAMALAAQATIAARLVAPEPSPSPEPTVAPPCEAATGKRAAFRVLVHGNRSEVALARTLLAA